MSVTDAVTMAEAVVDARNRAQRSRRECEEGAESEDGEKYGFHGAALLVVYLSTMGVSTESTQTGV